MNLAKGGVSRPSRCTAQLVGPVGQDGDHDRLDEHEGDGLGGVLQRPLGDGDKGAHT